jgi:hypothetical protein
LCGVWIHATAQGAALMIYIQGICSKTNQGSLHVAEYACHL